MKVFWIILAVIGGIVGLCVAAFLLYVLTLVITSLFVKEKNYSKNKRIYRFVLDWSYYVCIGLCHIRVHVEGMEKVPKGRILNVSNHVSNFDPILTWGVFRKYRLAYVSKPSNFKVPFYGKIIRGCGFRPIDRENPRNAMATIKDCAELLKSGEFSIGIYPEGSRNFSEETLLPFHDGVFRIAQLADAPIVAITVKGTPAIHRDHYKKITHVYIKVVDVIMPDEAKVMSTHEISARVREKMLEDLGRGCV